MAKKINIRRIAQGARAAALKLTAVPAHRKVRALEAMAAALVKNEKAILAANKRDMDTGKRRGLSGAMRDRLMLDSGGVRKMAAGVTEIAGLKDPVGRIEDKQMRPAGFALARMRVPIGVIAIIYESRPNVTSDAAALCIKSGNAVILKGGSESLHTNRVLVKVLSTAAARAGLPEGVIGFVDTPDRSVVRQLLHLDDLVDVVIPRGGEKLIRAVAEQARMPVIKHYKGVCHVYVDREADPAMAEKIVLNAKVQRPGVCNAMETLLLHKKLPKRLISGLLKKLGSSGVELRGGPDVRKHFKRVKAVKKSDWEAEYLELVLAVKLVGGLEEAIDHINTYGSKHTDAIITRNKKKAETFITLVDSSSVMVNASTRLSDGGVYGLGAEVGISTDKIHARGPMGIEDLTTYKWVVMGKGTIRT